MKILIILILLISLNGCSYLTATDLIATVESKERIGDKNNSRYLIYTDKEVLQNSDIWIRGKFRSSDLYGKLKVGKIYRFKVCGWRIPIASAYRNIINVEELFIKISTE